MAGIETEDEKELTPEEQLMNWQFSKAVLDFREGRATKSEAVNRMAYFSGILPTLCALMLREMRNANPREIRLARPELLAREPMPGHEAVSARQRAKKLRAARNLNHGPQTSS